MIVITVVSFYTTRITLQLLGVEDFGIRNVVSGIIGLMAIVTTAMVNAAQRFLTYDLGKRDYKQFSYTFSMLINIFFIISITGAILLEIIGPFFIYNYLTIPEGRMIAAQWIFQITVFSFVVSTMSIPYTSAVIACEKMDVFAYVSLLDAGLKLGVVYLLYIAPFDKLITVVFLTLIASVISNTIYVFFCHYKIDGCSYVKGWNKQLLHKLSSFMGWNLFGSATSVMNVQGQAILLNLFFGPIINAAKGIADTVHSLVQSFVSNFYMAVGPQIVKTYANNEKEYTLQLVIYSSKFAFFLVAIIGIPIIVNMEPLLKLWLGENQVSSEMILFAQWTLIQAIAQVFDYPITQTVRATGDIKQYQIITGLLMLSFIPICFVIFKIGLPAISSMVVLTILTLCVLHYRVIKLSKILDISYIHYYRKIVIPAAFSLVPSIVAIIYIQIKNDTFVYLLFSSFFSFIITALGIFLVGMNKKEKKIALSFIKKSKEKNK